VRAAIVLLLASCAAAQDLNQARALYQKTQYEEALKAIGARKDQPALQLAGQCYLGLEDYKKAIDVLEKAVVNSESHLWLGRAYGRRAETAMPSPRPALRLQSPPVVRKSRRTRSQKHSRHE
jgi:tetratricopeptide (TPR) repeat protein